MAQIRELRRENQELKKISRELREMNKYLMSRLRRYEPNVSQDLANLFDNNKKKEWENVADSFLRNIPEANTWYRKQIETGIGDIKSYELAICHVASLDTPPSAPQFEGCIISHPSGPLKIAEAYAQTSAALGTAIKFSKTVSLFRHLVLASFCAILEAQRVSVGEIDRIMRITMGTRSSAYQLKRIRSAAMWMNRFICQLAEVGCNVYRATELVFLCGISVHRYVKLTGSGDCMHYLLAQIQERGFDTHHFQDCFHVEYSIPQFIFNLTKELRPDFVLQILGYRTNPSGHLFRVCGPTTPIVYELDARSSTAATTPFTAKVQSAVLGLESLEKLVGDKSVCLLLIIFFLGGKDIPKAVIIAGCSPQLRWDQWGEIITVNAHIDPNLLAFLSNERAVDQAMDTLVERSLVHTDNGQTFTLDDTQLHYIAQQLSPEEKDHWNTQAWVLACHAFSRGRYLQKFDSDIRSHRVQMSNHRFLWHALNHLGLSSYQNLPLKVKCDLAETLLVASELPPQPWKERAVDAARQLIRSTPKCYLHLWVARREAHLYGNLDFGSIIPPEVTDTRLYAQYGRLLVSMAERHLQHNRIDEARDLLLKWSPPNELESPILMRRATFYWKLAMGKTLRYGGSFTEAKAVFEQLRKASEQDSLDWAQCRVLSHLGDLWCELGQHELVLEQLLPQITDLFRLGKDWLAMALIPSLGEAYMQQKQLAIASQWLQQADDFYCKASNLGNLDKLAHVRVSFALAKIATLDQRWQDALDLWLRVIDLTGQYGWGQGFTFGMANLSMSYVAIRLGRADLATMQISQEILSREGQNQFWMAMAATQWLKFIMDAIAGTGSSIS